MTFWKTSIHVSKCCSCWVQSVWSCVTSPGVCPSLLNRISGINSNSESWFWKKAKSNSSPNVMNKWVVVKNETLLRGPSLPNIWRSSGATRLTTSAKFKGQTMFGCRESGVLFNPTLSLYRISFGTLKASKKDSAWWWWVKILCLPDYIMEYNRI